MKYWWGLYLSNSFPISKSGKWEGYLSDDQRECGSFSEEDAQVMTFLTEELLPDRWYPRISEFSKEMGCVKGSRYRKYWETRLIKMVRTKYD